MRFKLISGFEESIFEREREDTYVGFWWGNLRKRNHLGDPGIDGRIILR